MTDKDEILAAIAALDTRLTAKIDGLGTRLETRMDVMANGIGRIEADVAQFRMDVAAYRMQSDARITALEARP